uniref:LRAT domain-containing protein n=1 Tax=Sander lucioperca TaxID=283035 RepID=A0A8D0DBI5_SANLU
LTPIDAKPGDLIEIDRGMYQHWALYIGGMEVVHLTTPSDSSGSSLMALDIDVGQVKREKIWEVVGNDNVKVNNLLDYKHQPHESYIIVKEACSMVGLELPYSIFTKNCEHFVTDLRYGKPESRQAIGQSQPLFHLLSIHFHANRNASPDRSFTAQLGAQARARVT